MLHHNNNYKSSLKYLVGGRYRPHSHPVTKLFCIFIKLYFLITNKILLGLGVAGQHLLIETVVMSPLCHLLCKYSNTGRYVPFSIYFVRSKPIFVFRFVFVLRTSCIYRNVALLSSHWFAVKHPINHWYYALGSRMRIRLGITHRVYLPD